MIDILKSEYLKFFYNKWLILTAFTTIFLVPLMTIYLHETPELVDKSYVLTQVVESYYLGQAGLMIIVIMYFGQEFVKNTLRNTLLTVPQRWRFVYCKIFVLLSMIGIIWLGILLFTIIAVNMYYSLFVIQPIIKLTLLIAFESFSLSVICLSIVILTESIVFSIGISLSFLLGLGHMLLQFSQLFLFFPILTTMNLFFLEKSTAYFPIDKGILVQSTWAILLLIVAIRVFVKRSVR